MTGFTAVGMQAVGLGVAPQATQAPPADTTLPTLAGPLVLTNITSSGAHAAWTAGSDNVAVAGYEISVDTGTPLWVDLGNVLACDISGKAPGTYTVRVHAYDGTTPRNYSVPITAPLTIVAPPTEPPVPTTIDISKISPSRIVVFEGSGSRVTRFT